MPVPRSGPMADTFELGKLSALAGQLRDKPFLHEVFQAADAKAYEKLRYLAATPFFQWMPFGVVDGKRYGHYGGKDACQAGALMDSSNNKWLIAGNRGGKTVAGLMEDVADCLNLDVITKQPSERFQGSVNMWVVSATEETSVNVCERTLVEQVFGEDESGFLWNYVSDESKWSPRSGWAEHRLLFTNGSSIHFKFSTQKRNTFQGVRLHKCHHDEVQPREIYGECMARLADHHGKFLGTMTPVFDEKRGGIPWIYEELFLHQRAKGITFHRWSMLDNPHIPQDAKDRLMQQWDDDEIEARVHGMFVPMGVKLAFNAKLLRDMRSLCVKPRLKGELGIDELGGVTCTTRAA